jgi:hypothetical protein
LFSSISIHLLARDFLIDLAEALTPEEQKQIMGNQGDVYKQHYIPEFINIDYKAIYLGTIRLDNLVQAVGRLERYKQAPTYLTNL